MTVEIAELASLQREALAPIWERVIGGDPPSTITAPFLRRILAFEMQAHRYGGLSPVVRRALERSATPGAAPAAPSMKPGARLLREWNGVSHVVDVAPDGFIWRGERYRSLTAVAYAITGARWSGPRFFGLVDRTK